MARPLRIQYEGAVYHILSRGNKSEHIFLEDGDKAYFVKTLEKGVDRHQIELYAYCIMDNHYHLLMSIPKGKLTSFMHFVGSSYGSYLRRCRKWIGHVFAGRYKSLCVEREKYLLDLSRYIHLNPVRAKRVKFPEEYNWSSYRFYIGQSKIPEWLNVGWLLQEYGRTFETSQKRYKEFIDSNIENPSKYPTDNIVGQAILGSKGFVSKVIEVVRKEKNLDQVISKRIFYNKLDLSELYNRVCDYHKLKELGKRGKMISEVKHGRDMFIYLAKEYTLALNKETSKMIGDLSPSGVTHQYKRVINKLEKNKDLLNQWEREATKIMSIFKG
ncbi:MAG: transposase [Candidatus Scalinduaceae bacterium]